MSDRLYKIAQIQKKKFDKSIEENKSLSVDEFGRVLFEPKLPEQSVKLATAERPQVPIEERLSYHGKLYEQKALIRESLREMNEQNSRKPAVKLNKKSKKIIDEKLSVSMSIDGSDHESIVSSTIWDYENRLLKPTGGVKKSTMDIVKSHTFQPTMNSMSQRLVEEKPHYDSNWRPKSVSTFRRSGVPFFLDSEPTVESSAKNGFCFIDGLAVPVSPGKYSLDNSVNITSLECNVSASDSVGRSREGPSIFYRSQHWAAERSKKLQQEAQKRSEDELKECSFVPVVSARASSTSRVKLSLKNCILVLNFLNTFHKIRWSSSQRRLYSRKMSLGRRRRKSS